MNTKKSKAKDAFIRAKELAGIIARNELKERIKENNFLKQNIQKKVYEKRGSLSKEYRSKKEKLAEIIKGDLLKLPEKSWQQYEKNAVQNFKKSLDFTWHSLEFVKAQEKLLNNVEEFNIVNNRVYNVKPILQKRDDTCWFNSFNMLLNHHHGVVLELHHMPDYFQNMYHNPKSNMLNGDLKQWVKDINDTKEVELFSPKMKDDYTPHDINQLLIENGPFLLAHRGYKEFTGEGYDHMSIVIGVTQDGRIKVNDPILGQVTRNINWFNQEMIRDEPYINTSPIIHMRKIK